MAVTINVDALHAGAKINKNLYGNFSEHLGRCIYGGVFVGKDSPIPNVNGMRTDVVEALKKIHLPVLRWPGGCFADEYHWRDGIGPQESRKRMVNTNWGNVVEDNSFGTHEFLELCSQIGCEPYINMNVGSGSVREMAEWVEYLNSPGESTVVMERIANGRREPWNVRLIGVGNENWGCGGSMKAEYYADVYRRYQTFCRNYPGSRLFRIACGPSDADWHWTETLMQKAGDQLDALSLHMYTITDSWSQKGSATEFDGDKYARTIAAASRMEQLLKGHLAIMDRYDPAQRVKLIVDEWGTWFDVEPGTNPAFLYQQNTMRDAMVAALTLNIFNHHADRLAMCNIAQLVNVLQSVLLTEGDKLVRTPTYHVFDLYQDHMEASLLESAVFCDTMENGVKQVSASASVKDGVVTVTAANLHATESAEVLLRLDGMNVKRVSGRILAGEVHAHNTFDQPDQVVPQALQAELTAEGVRVTLPPCSVAAIRAEA